MQSSFFRLDSFDFWGKNELWIGRIVFQENWLHHFEQQINLAEFRQNILVDADHGMLKIGDFGSAKVMKPNVESTAYQVTRFYRPLELLLDAVIYSALVGKVLLLSAFKALF
jgi:hypothetical protein